AASPFSLNAFSALCHTLSHQAGLVEGQTIRYSHINSVSHSGPELSGAAMIIRVYIQQPSGRVGVHAECWLLAGNRPSLLPGKDQKSVSRYDDGGGEGKALCSGALSNDLTTVSGHDGIHPVVIHVAVEDFVPGAGCGEADDIAVECGFVQAGDND